MSSQRGRSLVLWMPAEAFDRDQTRCLWDHLDLLVTRAWFDVGCSVKHEAYLLTPTKRYTILNMITPAPPKAILQWVVSTVSRQPRLRAPVVQRSNKLAPWVCCLFFCFSYTPISFSYNVCCMNISCVSAWCLFVNTSALPCSTKFNLSKQINRLPAVDRGSSFCYASCHCSH